MSMKTRAICIALLSALTLAACGGDDEEPAPSNEGTEQVSLEITAEEPGEEEYAFNPAELEADSGEVTIEMESPDGTKAPHGVSLEGDGVSESGEVVQAGGTSTVTADLDPGEYTYFCPVGDHRAEGMEGTLTVG